jgi:hypothetical protein
MPYVIVEYNFEPALTDDQLSMDSASLKPCIEARSIRRLRTYLAPDRRRGFCEFEAPDAESVREAFHTAGIKFARVWRADLYGPP